MVAVRMKVQTANKKNTVTLLTPVPVCNKYKRETYFSPDSDFFPPTGANIMKKGLAF